MKRLARSSLFKSRLGALTGPAETSGAALDGTSRRAFLQGSAGAAAGAAVILATPKIAAVALDSPAGGVSADPKPVVTRPSGPAAPEPVTAYVRNAERHEVTVMSGRSETTYKDPALVKRLLDAAR
jgi:hypothetical protein